MAKRESYHCQGLEVRMDLLTCDIVLRRRSEAADCQKGTFDLSGSTLMGSRQLGITQLWQSLTITKVSQFLVPRS